MNAIGCEKPYCFGDYNANWWVCRHKCKLEIQQACKEATEDHE